MASRNYTKLNNTTLITWVDKALNQSPTKQNIKFGFKVCGIWPLNLKAMEHKTKLSNIYITLITSENEEGEKDYNSNDETKSYQ